MSNDTDQQTSSMHFLDYWRVISSRKELILAVAFLVVLTGTVYTLLLPNIYASSSRILVSEDTPEINPFSLSKTIWFIIPIFYVLSLKF